MRPAMLSRCVRAVVYTLCLAAMTPDVFAQLSNPRRLGSPRRNESGGGGGDLQPTLPIGLRDCASEEWTFNLRYAGKGSAVTSLQLWMGTEAMSCSTMTARQPPTPTCWRIQASTFSSPAIPYNNEFVRVPARYLVDPVNGDCRTPPGGRGLASTNHLSLIVEAASGTTMAGMSLAIAYDMQPPEAATNVGATPGEESAEITWSYASGTTSDGDGGTTPAVPVGLQGFWVLCDPPTSGDSDAGDASVGDAGVDVPDQTFGQDGGADASGPVTCERGAFPSIDPNDDAVFNRYRRSDLVNPASTRVRVSNLRNNTAYRCVVVAQDTSGNRTMSTASPCVLPRPVTDFWERYRASGGSPHGVDCAAHAGDRTDGSLVACAAALALTALCARRRKHS